jgi:hypothetical protein
LPCSRRNKCGTLRSCPSNVLPASIRGMGARQAVIASTSPRNGRVLVTFSCSPKH